MIFRTIEQLSTWAYRKASPQNILLLLLLFVFLNLVVFPYHFESISPEAEISILDTRLGYSPEEALQTLSSFGEPGRNHYLKMLAITDTIYPFIYGMLLVLIASFFLNKGLQAGSIFRILNIVAIDAVIFDLVENICIISLILHFPDWSATTARIASLAGIIKWLAVAIAMMVILYGLMRWVFYKRNESLTPPE